MIATQLSYSRCVTRTVNFGRNLKTYRSRQIRRFRQPSVAADQSNVKTWIENHGGFIHDSLTISENAPCGARGVVATKPVVTDDLLQPLIVIPKELQLTDEIALATIEPLIPSEILAAAPLRTLDAGALVSLLLAHERAKGAQSFYWPYIANLPSEAPCPWMWTVDKVREELANIAQQGVDVAGWRESLMHAQGYSRAVARGMCQDYGAYLGITPEDILWAIGMMTSRGYGRDYSPGLIPYIDMVNHRATNMPFLFKEDPLEQSQGCYTVWSFDREGKQPRALSVGEELYVNYIMDDLTAFDAFCSHGFVPEEYLSS